MQKSIISITLVVLAVATTAQAESETVYFLVSKFLWGCDGYGYVLPLTEPADIEHARVLCCSGPFPGGPEPIVIAKIRLHVHGININRNYCHPSAPSWSWYVSEFLGFAHSAPEICDGAIIGDWPSLAPTTICFWSYTVVEELGTDLDPWCYALKPDCVADLNDLRIIASHWLESGCEYPGWCGGADVNVSGEVDWVDFALLAERWQLGN
ncbi:MAG: BP74-related protein [Planctomycetota bacterium]